MLAVAHPGGAGVGTSQANALSRTPPHAAAATVTAAATGAARRRRSLEVPVAVGGTAVVVSVLIAAVVLRDAAHARRAGRARCSAARAGGRLARRARGP